MLLLLLSWYRPTAGGCRGAATLLSRYRLALLSRHGLTLLSRDVLAALLRDLARLRSALLTRDGEASLAWDSHRNRFALLPIHRAALLSWHRAERLKSWRDAVPGGHNSGHIQGTCTAALGRSCTAVLGPGVAPGRIVGVELRCTAVQGRSDTDSEVLVGTLGWGRPR